MRKFITRCQLLAAVVLLAVVSSAQAAGVSSPGGIGLGSVTMWLDASKIDTTDTVNEVRISGPDIFVKRWDDQAGTNHAAQAVNDKQPKYVASGPNGRPTVVFDGASTTALADRLTMTNSTTLGSSFIVAEYSHAATFSLAAGTSDNYASLLSSSSNISNKWQFMGLQNASTWYTSSLSIFNNYYVNGNNTSNIASVSPITNYNFYGGTDSTPATLADMHLGEEVPGTFGGHRPWIGGVPEVITYSTVLSSVDRRLVENYLSSKYARPFGTPTNDHYTGEAAGYFHDVFGIGNDGTSTRLVAGTQGLDISASSLDANDWLLAGHNGSALQLVEYDSTNPFIIGQRWDREWFLDKSGALDATLTFDFEDAGLATPAAGSSFHLLYSTDANFADGWEILAETEDITSGSVTFSLLDLDLLDGYYTLGLNIAAVPEPNSLVLLLAGFCCTLLRRRKR